MLFAGWQDKDGNKLSGKVAITSDTTFTAVWVAKEHAEYGTLIYSLDFDDDMALNQPVASYGVVNIPEGFPAAATTKLVSGFTSTEIKDGAVYAKNEVEAVAGKRYYPGLGIQASSKYPDGRYYITYDVVSNKTATGAWTQASARLRGSGDVGLDTMDLEPDVQKNFSCYVTVLDGKVYFHAWNKDYVSDYKSVTEFDVMMIIGETASFVVDNIKLYYKAPVTVTFKDSTGNAATVPEAVKMIKGDTLDLSEITCTTENSTLSFEGWSYTAGGELIEGNPVINESKTLYAVWSDKIKPVSYNENSIRVNDPMGIRFKSSVKNEIKADSKTTEYGYIVTTRARLNGKADDYLTFEQNDVFYLTGVNYGYDEKLEANVNRVFGTDDKNTYFTAIVYGINPSKKNYEEVIVVRPYVKYDGQTVYGDPMARSVVDVAKALRDGGYNGLDKNSKKFVTDILEICGENV